VVLVLLFFFLFNSQLSAQAFTELELVKVSQLEEAYEKRFDLSGIVQTPDGKYYVIADMRHDRFIYEIVFDEDVWRIVDKIPVELPYERDNDFESLEYHAGHFYITDEIEHVVFRLDSGKLVEVPVNLSSMNENTLKWKTNTGFEGLAIDSKNKIMYLAKEREPRFLLKVELETGEILAKFDVPQTESMDFSDLKFENGFLYAIERNGNYITKIDPLTYQVVAKVSYRQTCTPPEGRLYSGAKYGMAEALLLQKDYIILGIDNNGLEVAPHAQKKYGISGKHPVILFFKRPAGF
ncbi:MAG: esterase-like activity of phytase family protein, partial [Cyclobacteriaceae bacterium]